MEQLNLFSIRVLMPPTGYPKDSPAFIIVIAYDGSGVAFPVPADNAWIYQLRDWVATYEVEEMERAAKQS